jgi:hypothetical protein
MKTLYKINYKKFEFTIQIDTALGIGIALGYDNYINPIQLIAQCYIIILLFTIRYR